MKVIAAAAPAYAGYSYRERCDRYLREFTRAELGQLRTASGLVRYTILATRSAPRASPKPNSTPRGRRTVLLVRQFPRILGAILELRLRSAGIPGSRCRSVRYAAWR